MLLPWILLLMVLFVAIIGGVYVAKNKAQNRIDHMHRGPR